jgi:hypothetical protein
MIFIIFQFVFVVSASVTFVVVHVIDVHYSATIIIRKQLQYGTIIIAILIPVIRGANWLPAGKFGILVFLLLSFPIRLSLSISLLAAIESSRAIIFINEQYGERPSSRTRVHQLSLV